MLEISNVSQHLLKYPQLLLVKAGKERGGHTRKWTKLNFKLWKIVKGRKGPFRALKQFKREIGASKTLSNYYSLLVY